VGFSSHFHFFWLCDWHSHHEGRALAWTTAGGDSSSVSVDYLAADGQTYSGALVFTLIVQALKHGKDAVEILFVKPDTVILYQNLSELAGLGAIFGSGLVAPFPELLTVDPDDGRNACAVILK
jgi:hypothetical protein